jgi:hypothetical protein
MCEYNVNDGMYATNKGIFPQIVKAVEESGLDQIKKKISDLDWEDKVKFWKEGD